MNNLFKLLIGSRGSLLSIPLTLTAAQQNSTVKMTCLSGTYGDQVTDDYQIQSTISGLQYRTDKSAGWNDYTLNTTITLSNVNDYVQFRNIANKLSNHFTTDHISFVMTGKINGSGNLMSMLNYSKVLTNSCFYALFKDCTSLLTGPFIDAIEAGYDACDKLYRGCTSLTTAPKIKIKSFTGSGYSLKEAFYGCTGLITVPENTIQIFNIKEGCCYAMFQGCSNLISVPNNLLPNLIAPSYCYQEMFKGCLHLINVPELPATTLSINCYRQMFQDCNSIIEAPRLPATTLAENCYLYMFRNCTSLITAPQLPATVITYQSYYGMFQGCTSLIVAPELPATTLTLYCYYAMFRSCSSLISAPELPATTLASNCYQQMFYGCSNLSKVNVSFTNWNGLNNATTDWLYGVAASGTFSKPVDLPAEYGASRIPTDWDVANEKGIPLTFTAEEENSSVKMITNGNVALNNLKYRTDENDEWQPYTINTVIPLDNVGDYVQFRNNNNTLSISNSDYAQFVMSGKISGSGDIQSLLNYNSNTPAYCFRRLFQGCSALTTPPDLTATSIGYYSYASMFNSTGIKTPPIISATLVSNFSCFYMFENCAQLLSAPELLTTTLKDHCYSNMFKNCSSLNYIKVHFTDWNSSVQATDNWVTGVAASGTFIKPPELTEGYGSSKIPNGWNVASYIEYLESTGTQYIDTGVKPDYANGDRTEISFYRASYTGSQPVVFGSRETYQSNGFFVQPLVIVAQSVSRKNIYWPSSIKDYFISVDDNNITIDGTVFAAMPDRVTSTVNMTLFALLNGDGNVQVNYSGMKLYDWKYYRNGVLAQHLIPVLDQNNVPCMYDTVSNTFKYNAGTGTFNYA